VSIKGPVRLSILFGGLLMVGLAGFLFVNSNKPLSRDHEGLPTDPISKDYVASQPDASLVYPGATLVSRAAYAEERAINTGAGVRITFKTIAVPMIVLDWYLSTLQRHGWRLTNSEDNTNPKLSAGVQRARLYQRGARERIDLMLCDGCLGMGPAGMEPVGAGEVEVSYSILPFPCVGQLSCGQGISTG
jgi:hypothetical protein